MSRAPKFGGEKIQQGVSFVFFYWTWHPSFIKFGPVLLKNRWWTMMNSSKVMVSKYMGNSISKTQIISLSCIIPNFNFTNATSLPPIGYWTQKNLQTKRSFFRSKHPSKSLTKIPAPPANLGSCRPKCWTKTQPTSSLETAVAADFRQPYSLRSAPKVKALERLRSCEVWKTRNGFSTVVK